MPHTLGPWHADGRDVMASPDVCIASAKDDARHIWPEARFCNALLMAAAPEMLGILREFFSLAGGWREAIVELEDFCSEPVRLKNMLAAADQIDDLIKQAKAAISKATGT